MDGKVVKGTAGSSMLCTIVAACEVGGMSLDMEESRRQLKFPALDCSNLFGTVIIIPGGKPASDFVVKSIAPPPEILPEGLETWLIEGMQRPDLGPGDQFFTPLDVYATQLCEEEPEQFLAAFTTINLELAQLGDVCGGDAPE